MYFVAFCNLINFLDVSADSNDAVKIEIETRGFLQLRKPRAVMALQKLLSPFAPALSGCWERCIGGQPRLMQFPLSVHNSLALFYLSLPAAAFARASRSPPQHISPTSPSGLQSATARSSSQSASSLDSARSSSSGQSPLSPGFGAAASVSLDSPLHARIR